ncbi:hypothetical protein DICPUDRAFT_148496 [Dictyostelium purpureum]|uniref:Sec1-like family protein n=1 Tax=Dictyostelium purpureum TaxID=5786 RepID=F0ZB99_DICPU|nr:uncharacterized protein DICPUDRAFT_148496 [Dictyostelium purpureum]EGC38806.1 hypothetical protein DICPUDRAFT_148496 [Dictyostelium purpureum]|eukprot:XP_003284700.1 hypothetical protein DICPUDRAFT_148496 [Dictyostelium purpureum]
MNFGSNSMIGGSNTTNVNSNNMNGFGFDQFSNNFSIRSKQVESINKMLSLKSDSSGSTSSNNSGNKTTGWQDVWKVLIFDTFCSNIIAPVLTKGALRNQGITLYLPLHSERQAIQDVPAIYFVLPTLDNIKRIAEDCKNKLYDNIYLNFASKLPNPLMEELASLTIQTDSVSMISKLYEQFLNFISLENDLFVLNNPRNSYLAFNDPTVKDVQAQENIDSVVDSLFSVLVTMGVVPIIRCPKNGAAEMIARELEKRIAQNIQSSGNLFSNNEMGSQLSSFYRPVLILLDRNIDLSVCLHHPWTYQALVHDVLNMNLNQVKVDVTQEGVAKKKTFDLDSSSDSFWETNTGSAFPSVAGEIKNLIEDYTQQKEKINQLTDVNVEQDELGAPKTNENKAKGLGALVQEVNEKKRLMDLHTNLATDLMKHIRDRQIDYFFSMEESIITRSLTDKKELASLITSPVVGENGGRGTLEDKIRLLIIYYLSTKNIPQSEMDQYEDALKKMGADLTTLDYFKKTKAFNESLTAIANVSGQQGSASNQNKQGGFMQMFTGYQGVESFANFFSQGVRSLLPKSKDLFVTRIVESVMDLKNTLDADFLYLDPKIQNKANVPKRTTPFKEAIVFTVGGGNYVEYQNLQDYSKKHNKKIIYGSNELITSKEFLHQIKLLKEVSK